MHDFSKRHHRFLCLAAIVPFWVLVLEPSDTVWAESGQRSGQVQFSEKSAVGGARVLAEANRTESSPFLPQKHRDARLPLALNGFSIVDLRDHQHWVPGSEEYQAVFDGQIYWFTSPRQQVVFAAAPQRYAPALGGDCVVTYAETGRRVPGDFRHGLLHQQRLYFFAGPEQRQQFRSSKERYANADVAHEGNCIVSKMDEQRTVEGLPETVVIVGGLRHHFLGAKERTQFLMNPLRYVAHSAVAPGEHRRESKQSPVPSKGDPPAGSATRSPAAGSELAMGDRQAEKSSPNEVDKESSKQKQLSESETVPDDTKVALSGYCPVSIHDKSTWVQGEPQYRSSYDSRIYQFVGADELAAFEKRPEVYIPALGGDCLVSFVNSEKRVPGSMFHAVFDEVEKRLYFFAGAEEKVAFKADPAAYSNADLVQEGICVVSQMDRSETTPGLSEHMIWYRGRRYFFASEEFKEKFLGDPDRYAEIDNIDWN